MKTNALIAGIVIVAANAAVLIASLDAYERHVQAASVALGLWLVFRALLTKDLSPVRPPIETKSPSPEPVATPLVAKNQAEAEVVAFLGVLQEKGRFVDFLMDDITAYGDAQVGAAARVVHQGCQSALKEHFEIAPVSSEKEGSTITVPGDESKPHYRLSGKIAGDGPFSGKLVHKGWKTEKVKLPRVIADESALPAIAPAQVEIR